MGILLITASVFIVIIIICWISYIYWQKFESKKSQTERLDKAINTQARFENDEKPKSLEELKLRKDKRLSTIPWLDEVLRKIFQERIIQLMILIEQSGLTIKVSEFLLMAIFIGFIGAILVKQLLGFPFVGLISCYLPFMWLKQLKVKRIDKFDAQMPQALDLLRGDLKAGLDVLGGLKHLAEDSKPPLSEEFSKIITEINLGVPITDALNNLAERMDTMDVQMLCTGIIINREMGGNLSELVGKVSMTVRERFRLQGIIKALTAEGKMSSIMLLALPFGMFAILNCLAPDTYNPFVRDPMGQKIIMGCLGSMTVGYLMIQKITALDV